MAKRTKSKPSPPRKTVAKRTGNPQSGKTNPAMKQANALIRRIVSLLTQGQAQQALVLIEKGMRLVPDHPEFAHLAGQIVRGPTQADKEAARQWLRRAVDLAPRNPHYAVSLSIALLRDDELEESLQWARYAVRVDGRFADAYTAIGLVLVKLERRREAMEAFSNALRFQPSNPDLWKNLALCRLELGDRQGVLDALSELEQRVEEPSAALLVEIAEIYRSLRHKFIARRYLKRATEKDPSSSEAWFRFARVLGSIGSYDDATEALVHAERLGYSIGDVRLFEGEILGKKGHVEEAERKLEEALLLAKDKVGLVLKISWSFVALGDFDAQRRCLNRVSEIGPKDDSARVSLGFGLGVAYEVQRDYQRAFKYFANANALSRKRTGFDFKSIEEDFRGLVDFYTNNPISDRPEEGCSDATPVFIAGTSRSGKSMTERLLCLHESVAPRAEAGVFPQLIQDLHAKQGMPRYPEIINEMSADTSRWLGREYVTQLRADDASSVHLTDTHPSNTQYIGLLRRCLPDAKIIVCRRAARDTCVSMFKKSYRGHRYTEDLSDIGRFWLLHERLLDLWRELFPHAVYWLSFERLMQSPEEEARALMNFCNIDAGAEYFARVRELVNDPQRWPRAEELIGVWKPYEAHLGELFAALGESDR